MGLNSDIAQNTFQTTDDTPSSIASYSFPSNASAIVQVRVIGTDASQNTIGLEQEYVIKRSLGNCSIVGSDGITTINKSDSALSAASAALSVNGSSISIDATGILATTITWAARMDILYLN